jgi:hypothetical protein
MKTMEFRVKNKKTRTCLKGFYIGGRGIFVNSRNGGLICKVARAAGR